MNTWRRTALILAATWLGADLSAQGGPTPSPGPRSLPAIRSRAEFDSMARTLPGPDPLPHVLFLIDRKDGNRIYYINSKRYQFHRDFVNSAYLSLERGQQFFANNFLNPNRRFIMGTIAERAPIRKWTFEFWEGDSIPADQIRLAAQIINQTFFQKVAFRPNSLRQEEASAAIPGLERVLESEITRQQAYQPIHLATGIGRLRFFKPSDDLDSASPDEIVVLPEAPLILPPVTGIICEQPSTPLSHINLLAASWGIPNAYIKDASEILKRYDGQWVSFEARQTTYVIRPATPYETQAAQARIEARRRTLTPRAALSVRRLAGLHQQRAASVVAYGAKSANLGEMMHARLPEASVPVGFTLPFFYYEQFLRENGLGQSLTAMLSDSRFTKDPAYRRERLAALRDRMQHGQVNRTLRAVVLRRAHARFPGKGLFVRSSTNSEDLPNFIGAGLYTTVPNVRGDASLIESIKTVWASVWNFEAFEARQRAGIDHRKIDMAVLIQEGINADSAGVMITTDPFDPDNRNAIYISAKRGLGIKVVEGKKVAEQLLFNPAANSVRVLTRSAEDSLLQFDERGGVREVPITGSRAVLTDDLVRRLGRNALRIKQIFGGRDQDIEWACRQNHVYIVQSRPYLSGG